MSDSIYLFRGDGTLEAAPNTPYATEDDLQELIAKQPELLAGALINPRDPRRWLLIRREAGVPDREGAGGYWALDHLLVDQDAVPTLVEVKRSSDPRIRREVVAQLLEYAANGSVYWDAAVVRAWFEADRQGGGRDPVTELTEFLGSGTDQDPEAVADRFWADFDGNLRASRIRLLFVAEAIPAPLRRLIEFLNEQMPGVEVLGVELPQYVGTGGSGLRAVVPRVVGLTEQARARKTTSGTGGLDSREPWTAEKIVERLAIQDPRIEAPARRVLEWARERGFTIVGNRGTTYASVGFIVPKWNRQIPLFRMYGRPQQFLEISFRDLMNVPPYTDEAERIAFHQALAPITRMAKRDPVREAYAYLEAGTAGEGAPLETVLSLLDGYLVKTASAGV